MGLSCPLGIARVGPAKAKFCWRNVLALFFAFYGPRLRLGPQKRKKELGQYPAILTEQAWSITHILNH